MQKSVLKSFIFAFVKFVVEYLLGQHSNQFCLCSLSMASDRRGVNFEDGIASNQRVFELIEQLLLPCFVLRRKAKHLHCGIDLWRQFVASELL